MRAAGSILFGATHLPRHGRLLARARLGKRTGPREHRYIAQRYADGIPVTVVSDTLTEADTGPWRDQTTIVRRADAHAHVARLREQDGGDAVVYGSRTLWGDLLAHGLVDELHLWSVRRWWPATRTPSPASPRPLRLLDVRRFDGSDNVLLSYAPATM